MTAHLEPLGDLESDAKVLKTMLRQEGLAEDNLGKRGDAITDFGVSYVTEAEEEDEIETVTSDQLRPVSQVLER